MNQNENLHHNLMSQILQNAANTVFLIIIHIRYVIIFCFILDKSIVIYPTLK